MVAKQTRVCKGQRDQYAGDFEQALHLLLGAVVVGVLGNIGDVDVLSKKFLAVLGGAKDGGVEVEQVDLFERESLGLRGRDRRSKSTLAK